MGCYILSLRSWNILASYRKPAKIAPYFYLRNLQGDVVDIHDAAGSVVATYDYAAWGNILDISGVMGYINPIRYRGYYCDNETGFYYCQSRYYNPQWCRWISADVYTDTGDGILGTNMYAYCQNDPVNAVDPSGYKFDDLSLLPDSFSSFFSMYYDVAKIFSSLFGKGDKAVFSAVASIGFSALFPNVVEGSAKLTDLTFTSKEPYYGKLLFGSIVYTKNDLRETRQKLDFVVGSPQAILDWLSYLQDGNYKWGTDLFTQIGSEIVSLVPMVNIISPLISISSSFASNKFRSGVYEALTPYKNIANLLVFIPIRIGTPDTTY